jgi:hypothetical protein
MVVLPIISTVTGVHNGISYAQSTPPGLPNNIPSNALPGGQTPASEECGFWCKNVVRPLVIYPIAILVHVAGTALLLTGKIFDVALDFFASNFGGWLLQKGLDPAIRSIWIFFRDTGNLLLIGMFIFIALRTILGVGGSNNKQLVINVIIVALLINFSLFFVKAAIDVTNFFAFQFYKNISTLEVDRGGQRTTEHVGVSTRFATAMGIASFASITSDSANKLYKTAEGGSIYQAAAQGIGMVLLYVGAAYVFGWGALLLAARGITLIFLMVISSLAFTAYIIPSTSQYFTQWRDALFKNAIFAPLLLALLWASVMLTDTLIRPNANAGAMLGGQIFSDASKNDAFAILINYILVFGFMYASIKLAQSIAGDTDGVLSMTKGLKTRMLAGSPIATWVNWRQGKAQERHRDAAYKDYTESKANVDTAYARLAKRPRDTNLQNAYKDALAKQEAMKKSLDNPASAGKLNAALSKIAGGLGGKVQKPEGEKLLTSVNKKEKEQKDAAGEAAKLVRDSRKEEKAAAEQQKQSERNTQEIVQAVKSQREDMEKEINLQKQLVEGQKEQRDIAEKIVNTTDPNGLVNVPGKGLIRKGEVTQEQLRSSQAIIDEAKRKSDLISKLVEKRDSITVESETQRRAAVSEKAAKEEAARQESEVGLLKQIAKLRGKELDNVGVKEAQRIVGLKDTDYQKEQNRANSARYRQEQLDAVKSLKEEKKAEEKK